MITSEECWNTNKVPFTNHYQKTLISSNYGCFDAVWTCRVAVADEPHQHESLVPSDLRVRCIKGSMSRSCGNQYCVGISDFIDNHDDRLCMATLFPSNVAKYRLGNTSDAALFHLDLGFISLHGKTTLSTWVPSQSLNHMSVGMCFKHVWLEHIAVAERFSHSRQILDLGELTLAVVVHKGHRNIQRILRVQKHLFNISPVFNRFATWFRGCNSSSCGSLLTS